MFNVMKVIDRAYPAERFEMPRLELRPLAITSFHITGARTYLDCACLWRSCVGGIEEPQKGAHPRPYRADKGKI